MENAFIIPLSYKGIFEKLGPEAARSLIAKQIRFARPLLPKPPPAADGDLTAYFLKAFASGPHLKHAVGLLFGEDLKQLRRIARRGAVNPAKGTENALAISSLAEKGFAVTLVLDKERVVSAPLEVCLAVPFDESEQISSLLQSFNRYPQEVVKSIATLRNEPFRGHKIGMATLMYESIVRDYPALEASLTAEELELLRMIFRRGGRILLDEVSSWRREGQPYARPGYNAGNDGIYRFLYFPDQRDASDLSPWLRTVLSLLAKGVLAFDGRDSYYRYDQQFFIPAESLPYVSEIFLSEMDRTRTSVEKEMYVEGAPDFVSYGERILEDARKMQVAAACGLVERRSDGEPKKTSLARIGRLIDGDETYVANLLHVFEDYIYHPLRRRQPGRVSEPAPNAGAALAAAAAGHPVSRGILNVLLTLSGWMQVEKLATYLANHRELQRFGAYAADTALRAQFVRFHLCGLLEMSADGHMARVSPFARRLMGSEGDDSRIDVIAPHEKSLLVQGNLEILAPYNVHILVLQSVSSFAALTVLDRMLHFTLTKASLIAAAEKGWGHSSIVSYLKEHAAAGVPQPVERFIKTIGAKQGEALIAPSVALIRCKGLGMREKLLAMKDLDCYGLPGAEEYLCVLNGQPAQIERLLKKKGIFAEIREIIS